MILKRTLQVVGAVLFGGVLLMWSQRPIAAYEINSDVQLPAEEVDCFVVKGPCKYRKVPLRYDSDDYGSVTIFGECARQEGICKECVTTVRDRSGEIVSTTVRCYQGV